MNNDGPEPPLARAASLCTAWFFTFLPVAALTLITYAVISLATPAAQGAMRWYARAGVSIVALAVIGSTYRVREMLLSLRREEEKYRLVVSNASEAILIDNRGRTLEANHKTCEMMGCVERLREGFCRMNRDDCTPCATLTGYREQIFDKADGRSEIRLPKRDGTELIVEVSRGRFADGRAMAVLCDMTARRRAEQELRDLLREKELLLREVHHRVKNNLQIICSLLSLQADAVPENARAGFLTAQERVNSIALAHETLYRSEDMARVDFAKYIARIATHLCACYADAGPHVSLHTRVDVDSLDLDRAVPCGLIVTELVSNALKHAFTRRPEGDIFVDITPLRDGLLRISVRDNGVGLAPSLPPERTDSLGLELVRALTRQLNGQLRVSNQDGAEFEVIFDARPAAKAHEPRSVA